MKIVVDAHGGDNAPKAVVDASVYALKLHPDLKIVFCGDKNKIDACLKGNKFSDRIEIVHAPDIISNNESPTLAIRQKKDASLVRSFDLLKNDDEIVGLLSGGSTGAILTGSILKIGRLNGVLRPALCPFLPTKNGGSVALIDCGANVDSKPENLVQFAVMGSVYVKSMLGIEKPRVALLNVGTEDKKGNELSKEVFNLLKKIPELNFVGNMEARDALSGDYDLIVADGFSGNILLKGMEGALKLFKDTLKDDIKKSPIAMFGSLFLGGVFKKVKKQFDYNRYGGSAFIGAKKIVLKAHGSSNLVAFEKSIEQIITLSKMNFGSKIEEEISMLSNLDLKYNSAE